MEFSLQYFGNYEESLKRARWAESNGFVSFAVADHYFAGSHDEAVYDNLALLAGLARETTSIELAVLVSPVTFRHPAVLAKMAGRVGRRTSMSCLDFRIRRRRSDSSISKRRSRTFEQRFRLHRRAFKESTIGSPSSVPSRSRSGRCH